MAFNDDVETRAGSRKPTREDQILGRQLKAVRKRAGRNQEWLARELGITYQQLGKYERGESSLKVWMLAKASGVLGVSPLVFLEAITPPGFAEPRSGYEAAPDTQADEFRQAVEQVVALWPKVKPNL